MKELLGRLTLCYLYNKLLELFTILGSMTCFSSYFGVAWSLLYFYFDVPNSAIGCFMFIR